MVSVPGPEAGPGKSDPAPRAWSSEPRGSPARDSAGSCCTRCQRAASARAPRRRGLGPGPSRCRQLPPARWPNRRSLGQAKSMSSPTCPPSANPGHRHTDKECLGLLPRIYAGGSRSRVGRPRTDDLPLADLAQTKERPGAQTAAARQEGKWRGNRALHRTDPLNATAARPYLPGQERAAALINVPSAFPNAVRRSGSGARRTRIRRAG